MTRKETVTAILSPGRPWRRHAARVVLSLLAALGLGACSALLDDGRAAPTTWWLEPTDLSSAPALPALTLELAVVPGLDSDRILTLDGEAQLNHFAGALWPERLPEWMLSLVERSLATAPVAASGAACRVELDLQRFWARLGADQHARRVEIEMAGAVQCGGAQPVAVSAEASEAITEHRLPEIVAAFQRAFDRTQWDLARQLAAASASG